MSANELKSRALRLLATREHSRVELRRKLTTKEACDADVEAVLDRMVETGLQSDQRFAESYVRSRADRLGLARLRYELIERGVAADLVEATLAQGLSSTEGNDELARARAVWAKKFGTPPANAVDWAKQARFIQSRGFGADVIRKLLKEPFDESA